MELAVFTIGFVLVLWRYRGVKCTLAFRPLREYYAYSLPLMPYVIMSWLSSFVDRFYAHPPDGSVHQRGL